MHLTRDALSRGLIVLLCSWGCAIIAPEFARVFGDYGTLGFLADNDGVVTLVSGPPAAAPYVDLHEGDRIDLKRTSRGDLLAVFGGMGGMTYVRPDLTATLFVDRKDATNAGQDPQKLELAADVKPITTANRVVLLLTQLFGLFFIAVATAIVWQRPNAMTWGFFLYAIWFNPGQFFVAYAELQRWPDLLLAQEVLQSLAQAIGLAGFIAFAMRFPRNEVPPGWQWAERWLLPMVALTIFVVTLLGFGTALGIPSERFGRWSYVGAYLVAITVLLVLRVRRRQQPPEDEQRTRWVHWACRVGLLAFVAADSNMATSWWDPVWDRVCAGDGSLARLLCDGDGIAETPLLVLFLPSALVPFAVLHAIRNHRVINVSFAVSRGTTLLLTWLILAGIITFVSIEIEDQVHSRTTQFIWYFVAIYFMKVAFEWVHEHLNEACDKIFFHRLHMAERKLGEMQTQLRTAVSFDAIDRRLIEEPTERLAIASGAVFRRSPEGGYRSYVDLRGWSGPLPEPIAEASVQRLCENACGPIRIDHPLGPAAAPQGVAQPVIAVPIAGTFGVAAVALYGSHHAGDALTTEELALLGKLGETAGTAYVRVEALTLQEEVRRFRRDLDRLPYDLGDDVAGSGA